MLSKFLNWWFKELAALFGSGPGSVGDHGQYLALRMQDGKVQFGLQRRGHVRPLTELATDEAGHLAGIPEKVASIDPVHHRCRIILPADRVLARELELPLAAEENLYEVLRFEMDRQTPFRADEVYFDYRIVSRDNDTQKLRVSLQLTRRALVDNLLTHLGHWGLRPVHSPAINQSTDDLTLDFEPDTYQEPSSTGSNLVLALVVLVLAVVAITLPMRGQKQFREQLDTRLEAARTSAAQAVKIRDLLDGRRKKVKILRTAKDRPAMVVLLEEITHILPDTTYLFRLEVRDQDINLQGSSNSASELIGLLEKSPALVDVRFASPVTREGNAGRERFHISAKLSLKPFNGTRQAIRRKAPKRS